MPNEVSTGELARRLDEIARLLQGLVGRGEYTEYQRLIEHRFTELERDHAEERTARRVEQVEERQARKAAIKELRDEFKAESTQSGSNVRQAIYSGLIPGVVFLLGVLFSLRGGR